MSNLTNIEQITIVLRREDGKELPHCKLEVIMKDRTHEKSASGNANLIAHALFTAKYFSETAEALATEKQSGETPILIFNRLSQSSDQPRRFSVECFDDKGIRVRALYCEKFSEAVEWIEERFMENGESNS
jgi:hypothetical protein